MNVLFIPFSYSVLQGMCPRPDLWRQIGFDLALQSRAPTRAKPVSSEPAALEDMPSSIMKEPNPFLVGMITPGSMQTGSLEKHARELLTQFFSGSRSIVTDSGSGFASIQVISDETGELNPRGGERKYAGALDSVKVEEDAKTACR